MQKDQAYHEDAITYNEDIAEFAENLAPKLKNETVNQWCLSVAKQHRFHAKRHRSALNKILLHQPAGEVEQIVDGLDVPEPKEDEVESEDVVETPVTQEPVPEVLSDGCSPYHNPTNPNCDFNPNKGASRNA